jgi:serine/threonine protein kinase
MILEEAYRVGESIEGRLFILLPCKFIYVDIVEKVLPRGGSGGDNYVVRNPETSELFVIKSIPIPEDFDKQKFEEVIQKWKSANDKTPFIVRYYNHWYSKKYTFILMEYCSNGDLSEEILKKSKEKKKFTEKVIIIYIYLFVDYFTRRSKNTSEKSDRRWKAFIV